MLENPRELDRYRAAVPGAQITICRLTAPHATRTQRLLARMPPGAARDWHLNRSIELDGILERVACEDFTVENDSRLAREVALEVLAHTGWPDASLAAERGQRRR